MRLHVYLKVDNAAFVDQDDPRFTMSMEVRRCLSAIADRIEVGVGTGSVMDVNGNTVGRWELVR